MIHRILSFLVLLLLTTSCNRAQTISISYSEIKEKIENKRLEFQSSYHIADSTEKTKLIADARAYVFEMITGEIYDSWYGTPWDFNGTTTIPGTGTIACGYFVTTVLQDAGFNIPRVKWAQLASETFILKMTNDVKRFRNRPVEEVIDYLNQQGDGLYVTGLDIHTGFIYKSGETLLFVHSNYYEPETGVMAQPLDSHNPLNNSSYRIIGKLLGDEMMKNWILGIAYN